MQPPREPRSITPFYTLNFHLHDKPQIAVIPLFSPADFPLPGLRIGIDCRSALQSVVGPLCIGVTTRCTILVSVNFNLQVLGGSFYGNI